LYLHQILHQIKIHKKESKNFIVSEDICFLSEYKFPLDTIEGFEKYLKKKLDNQKIHQISQNENNRLIYFKLDKFYLIFEFFSKSNIILTDLDFKIITSKQKEEWKDRIIAKDEIYKFPDSTQIQNYKKDINKEITDLSKPELIKYFSKKFNIAPVELNKLEEITVKNILEIYEIKNPILEIQKNNYVLVKEKKNTNLFYEIEEHYLKKYSQKITKKEDKKITKAKKILTEQEKYKKELLNKIKILKQEGDNVYLYFTKIDQINNSINKALEKEVPIKTIIEKINKVLKDNKNSLEIKKIDRKSKSYILYIK
jgi:predicted ribosome quality control (RQC) complex YloA/Tae2 family protein